MLVPAEFRTGPHMPWTEAVADLPLLLPPEKLLCWVDNPRKLISATDSTQAMYALWRDEKDRKKLLALAEDIAHKRMSPLLNIGVRSIGDSGLYEVLEGNRRVAAVKALRDPSMLAPVLTSSELKRLRKAARGPHVPELLRCMDITDDDNALGWVERRHTGEDGGVGRIGWGPQEVARFKHDVRKQPVASLELLELVLERGDLTDDELDSAERLYFTTFERFVDSELGRGVLGITVVDQRVEYLVDEEVAARAWTAVYLAVLGGLQARAINNARQILSFIDQNFRDALPSPEEATPRWVEAVEAARTFLGRPDAFAPASNGAEADAMDADGGSLSGGSTGEAGGQSGSDDSATGEAGDSASEGASDADAGVSSAGTASPSRAKHTKLANPELELWFDARAARVADIFDEMQRIPVSRYPTAAGTLLRVFLELSMDALFERHPELLVIKGKKDKKQNREHVWRYTTLRDKSTDVLSFLVTRGSLSQEKARAIQTQLRGDWSDKGIEVMNAFLHNKEVYPEPAHLQRIWDSLEPLYQVIWSKPAGPDEG